MQGAQTPVTFSRDLTKEAPCHEGQIPWDTPASLGVRASCPSSCSSHTDGPLPQITQGCMCF